MLDVAIYGIARHHRSQMCCQAMFSGIMTSGDKPRMFVEMEYARPTHPVGVFYGYTATLRRIMADQIKAGGKAVYIDLGYWDRIRNDGHHKISVNARHPTAYFMARPMDGARIQKLGIQLMPWRRGGRSIVIAGMGQKAAEAEGTPVEKWERDAIQWLARTTKRRLIYRPKPSWILAKPLPGAEYSPKEQSLNSLLGDCHAVVTHHSNVAVEALVAGVPTFCWKGVAEPLSLQDLDLIEQPHYPEGRVEWMNAISYCQWSIDEMQQGLPWRHLKDEGLIAG
jgi:hypothetical protein